MSIFMTLFGEGEALSMFQIGCRAFVMFFIALFLIRICGMRTYRKKSAFDMTIIFVLGAVLSRGIVGASPFFHVVIAGLVMVLVHIVVAWGATKSRFLETLIEGKRLKLIENGSFLRHNMRFCRITENDLLESVRLELMERSIENIEAAYLEVNGRISFIKSNRRA